MGLSKLLSLDEKGSVAFFPIKPKYANKIIAGEKRYEFRRAAIRRQIKRIVIYASTPTKRIIGVGKVAKVISSSPTSAWTMAKHAAGISRRDFRNYFSGKRDAYSIEIENVVSLGKGIAPRDVDPNFKIPQSFAYVTNDFFIQLCSLSKGENGN